MSAELPEGWIAHDGGPCPVPADTRVQIWMRGERWTTAHKSAAVDPDDYEPQWRSGVIVAYKPVHADAPGESG